jgi:hypothetical protein
MTLPGEGVDDFNLAIFDIDKAINPLPGLCEKRPGWIMSDSAFCPKSCHMGLRKRYTLHFSEVAAYRLQIITSTTATTTEVVNPRELAKSRYHSFANRIQGMANSTPCRHVSLNATRDEPIDSHRPMTP